jgi:hypothetical protein
MNRDRGRQISGAPDEIYDEQRGSGLELPMAFGVRFFC